VRDTLHNFAMPNSNRTPLCGYFERRGFVIFQTRALHRSRIIYWETPMHKLLLLVGTLLIGSGAQTAAAANASPLSRWRRSAAATIMSFFASC
jgi:hypothetical protein